MKTLFLLTATLPFAVSACFQPSGPRSEDDASLKGAGPSENRPLQILGNAGLNLAQAFLEDLRAQKMFDATVTLPVAFVTTEDLQSADSAIDSSKTSHHDSEWLRIRESERKGALVTCSAWFDTFIGGEQKEFVPKDSPDRGLGGAIKSLFQKQQTRLAQFRLCRGPKRNEAGAFVDRIVATPQSFWGWCQTVMPGQQPAEVEWLMVRDFPTRFHALMVSNTNHQQCAPWKEVSGGHTSFDHLGTQQNYSFSRTCTFSCDGLPGTLCSGDALGTWTEIAQFPTKTFAEATQSKTLFCETAKN